MNKRQIIINEIKNISVDLPPICHLIYYSFGLNYIIINHLYHMISYPLYDPSSTKTTT